MSMSVVVGFAVIVVLLGLVAVLFLNIDSVCGKICSKIQEKKNEESK